MAKRGGLVVEPERVIQREDVALLHQITTKWASSSCSSCFMNNLEVVGDKGQAIRCHKAMSAFFLARKHC